HLGAAAGLPRAAAGSYRFDRRSVRLRVDDVGGGRAPADDAGALGAALLEGDAADGDAHLAHLLLARRVAAELGDHEAGLLRRGRAVVPRLEVGLELVEARHVAAGARLQHLP